MQQEFIDKIISLHHLAKEDLPKNIIDRDVLTELSSSRGKELVGIVGARGSGKTVLLKQLSKKFENSFYLALDSIDRETNIFDLLVYLNKEYHYQTFLLDEVHFNKSINQHLKLLYDFSKIKVFFTSSVALEMYESAYDLSRRVKLFHVSRFSFREYVNLRRALNIKKSSLSEILSGEGRELLRHEDLFNDYLNGGSLPFSLEIKDWKHALEKTLEKALNYDLTRIEALTLEDTENIKKAVKHLGSHPVDGMNPSSIAKNVGISRYKAENYLNLLEKSFIVNQVWPSGKNVLKESKVLLGPCFRLLYQDFENCIGELREDFAVDCLKSAMLDFYYLKSMRGEKTPDFFIKQNDSRIVLEVGGKGKSTRQFKGLEKDFRKFIFKQGGPYSEDRMPLCLLGGLY